MLTTLLALFGAVLLLTLSPGADFLLVTRETVKSGRRAGLLIVLGICCGEVFQGLIVGSGLSLLLTRTSVIFHVLQISGGIYLIYLGIQSMHQERQFTPVKVIANEGLLISPLQNRYLLRGFVSNILNPKVLLCYIALVSQAKLNFLGTFGRALLVSMIHVSVSGLWLVTVILSLEHLRFRASLERLPSYLSLMSTIVLILLGCIICFEAFLALFG